MSLRGSVMRQNLPVTDKEVPVRDDRPLISSTNDRGVIKYVNEAFVAVSGFREDELIDQPHNLIRHPDMPPMVFEHMWNHLKAGKRVARLALTWQDRISFVLDADMSLKRIRFLDAVQDERAETESHSDAERFDSDFAIMSLELGRLIPRLLTVMDAGEGA